MASGDGTTGSRQSASDYLTRRVVELIGREGLQSGDRLPTVQAMARRFSVALPTMRECLRRLQAVGVLDIRHGSGVYVRRRTRALVLPNPYPGRLSGQTVLDLLEARLLIEPRLARLATERIEDTQLAELRWTLQEAGAHLRGEDQLLGRFNMGFHRTIALLSGSTVLAQVIDSLVDIYQDEQLVAMRLYDDRERDHNEHLAILDAIAGLNPALAERRMRDHLEEVRDVLATRIEKEDSEPQGEEQAAER